MNARAIDARSIGGWAIARRRAVAVGALLGALLGLAPSIQAQEPAAEDFVVSVQKQPAGTLKLKRSGPRVQVEFSWRDNGRGPDLDESFLVGAQERPLDYRARGKSTFGGEIREDFRFADGRVRWESVVDRGDEAAPEGSVFVPLQASPAYTAQLLRAVLAQPDASAPAGTAGRLRAQKLAQMEVEGAGGRVPVALYAITGADAYPWYLWLRDGPGQALFAQVEPGWALTPVGFEFAAEQLLERQRAAQAERLLALQQRAAMPLPGLTLIRNVRWFDSPAARLRGPADVYLAGGRISRITAPGLLKVQPEQVVDGSGLTLLPGLFDMHAHIWPDEAPQHLAAGVTTVRDMANQNEDLWSLKRRIDSGQFPGPTIVPAGFIEGQSAFSARNGFVVDSLEKALEAVDWYAARGYHQIKLYNSFKPEWVRPTVARAHQHGMTVAGHVPAFMRAEEAVRAGYDELTHINQLMLNFFVKPEHDTRTLLRFTLVGDEARKVSPQSPQARRFIALLKARGTAVDPTLATFEGMFTQRDGEPNPALVDVADHLPVIWRRGLLSSESSPDEQQIGRWRASFANMLAFVGAMHRAGVTLVAGTDFTAGLGLYRELELYVKAGIPPAEVLRIATWNAARVAGVAARSGSIEAGKDADLLLVEGDPTRNIGDLRRASLVFKGGSAYSPAVLWQSLGMREFAPPAVLQRAAP